MTARTRGRRRSVLSVVAGLLVASALIRIAAQAGPALAQDTTAEMTPAATQVAANAEPADPGSLLAALQAREAVLAEREAQMRDRLAALREAEALIDEKLAALSEAEARLRATIAQADSAAETDLAQLTTVYENMKPKEAAALFSEMTPEFAAGFLGLMRPDTAAAIMTELDPETAYSFSVVLAGRNAALAAAQP